MTDTELQKLKCFLVWNQQQLLLSKYYGISCDETSLNSDLEEALNFYYWYTTCPEEHCEITDYLKSKINTCKLPFTDCPDIVTLNCNSIGITDLDSPNFPCNSITIQ